MSKKQTKRLTTYFFRGHYLDETNDSTPIIESELWIQILQAVSNTPVDITNQQTSRYIDINNNIYFMLFYNPNTKNIQNEFIKDKNNLVYGIIFKRRDANWPLIENGQGTLREIQTRSQDESITEQAYFILNVKKSLLVFAGNQRSATSSILAKYFSKIFNQTIDIIGEKENENEETININFRFIMHPDAEQELENMNFIKRLDLQLSGGDFLDNISKNKSTSTIEDAIMASIKAAKDFGGRTIKLGLVLNTEKEVSRIKKFMTKIQEFILSFKGETKPSKSQNQCLITGVIDEETRTLNLLEDKLVIKATVEVIGKYFNWSDIFDKLNECYQTNTLIL